MIPDDFPESGDNFETVGRHDEVTAAAGRIVSEVIRAGGPVSTDDLVRALGISRRDVFRTCLSLSTVGILRGTGAMQIWRLGALVENEIRRRESLAAAGCGNA